MRKRSFKCPPRYKLLVSATALLALTFVGFLLGRQSGLLLASAEDPATQDAGSNSGVIDFPSMDATPAPGETPDKTKPFWYVPYENADRLAEKFRGTLNGLELGAASGPVPQCEKMVPRSDWRLAVKGTPFEMNFAALPDGVAISGGPLVATCSDGRVLWLDLTLDVKESALRPGVTESQVFVARWADVRWSPELAPAARWSSGTIAGRPAALLDQAPGGVGHSAVFVVDEETSGSTRFMGLSTSLSLNREIAEAIYR